MALVWLPTASAPQGGTLMDLYSAASQPRIGGIGWIDSWRSNLAEGSTPYAPAGIRALMLAVLEDGIRCFLGSSRTLAAEAEAWIFGRDTVNPFCFVTLCEALGLDPAATRRALLRLRSEASRLQLRLPRARHNVRSASRVRPRRPRRRSRKRSSHSIAVALTADD